jgi:pentalenene synthase
LSQDWRARSARNWADFFATFPLEDHNHRNGIIQKLSRSEAIDEAVRIVHQQLADFTSLYKQVPRLCAPLDLNRRECDAVARFTEALCIWISGSYAWSAGANRYVLPAAQSA